MPAYLNRHHNGSRSGRRNDQLTDAWLGRMWAGDHGKMKTKIPTSEKTGRGSAHGPRLVFGYGQSSLKTCKIYTQYALWLLWSITRLIRTNVLLFVNHLFKLLWFRDIFIPFFSPFASLKAFRPSCEGGTRKSQPMTSPKAVPATRRGVAPRLQEDELDGGPVVVLFELARLNDSPRLQADFKKKKVLIDISRIRLIT